jgi:hypothetical protein
MSIATLIKRSSRARSCEKQNHSSMKFYRLLMCWSMGVAFGIAGRAGVPTLLFRLGTHSVRHHAAPAGPHVIPVFEMASQIRRAKFQSKLALAYKCRVGRGSVGTCVAMTFEVQQFTQFRMLSNGTAYCIQYKTCPSVCIYKCIMFHKNNDKGARW